MKRIALVAAAALFSTAALAQGDHIAPGGAYDASVQEQYNQEFQLEQGTVAPDFGIDTMGTQSIEPMIDDPAAFDEPAVGNYSDTVSESDLRSGQGR